MIRCPDCARSQSLSEAGYVARQDEWLYVCVRCAETLVVLRRDEAPVSRGGFANGGLVMWLAADLEVALPQPKGPHVFDATGLPPPR